jgi:hypothetical protein
VRPFLFAKDFWGKIGGPSAALRVLLWTVSVIIIPSVFRTPFAAFGIPPLVVLFPAILASFSQFVTRVLGLLAVPSVVFNSLVQAMICFFGPVLAFRLVGANTRRARKEQKTDQSRESDEQFPVFQYSQTPFIVHLVLLSILIVNSVLAR